jgi:hypothetical protein
MSRLVRLILASWIILFVSGCLERFMVNNDGRLTRTGIHPIARKVEDNLDWGPGLD